MPLPTSYVQQKVAILYITLPVTTMQFFILFVLLTAAWALDCNETPELCSPPGNHFHRNLLDGFCHNRKGAPKYKFFTLSGSMVTKYKIH